MSNVNIKNELEKYKKMYWSLQHENKRKEEIIMEMKRKLSIYESSLHVGTIRGLINGGNIGIISSDELDMRKITFHKSQCRGFILRQKNCIEKKVQFKLDFTHGRYQAVEVQLLNSTDHNLDLFDAIEDFSENPNIFETLEEIKEIKESDIFDDKDIWYMNGYNIEYKEGLLKIWESLIDHGFVYTFINYKNGVNKKLIGKVNVGDIINWYFPGRGYVAILEVTDNLTIMDDETLQLISPSFTGPSQTKEEAILSMKNCFSEEKWTFIKIPVRFLAHVNKDNCVNENSFTGSNQWIKGLRGANAQKPCSEDWKQQTLEMYYFMKP
jgi:hypothetical protein